MQKGRIIFLNGVTSSGKTSIVEALQERDDIFFYVVANDLFEQMVGDKYLQQNYWKYLSDVIIMMYHTAKLYSDMGKNVLIDGLLVEREEIKPHYKQLLEILKDNPDTCVRIPMIGETRSLNLSNSVAIVLYEALRQNQFDHMKLEGELHRLSWDD